MKEIEEERMWLKLCALERENKSLNDQIKAYKEVLETRREHEARSDERYYDLREENKRLREALESIAKGMTINPPNEQIEGVVGYFMGFAQAVLKGKP